MEPLTVDLIDINGAGQQIELYLMDSAGRSRVYDIPAHWTHDITTAPEGYDTLDLTTLDPQPGEGGGVATATEDPGF